MEFSLPEFPTAAGAQAAFVAVCLLLLVGVLLLSIPAADVMFDQPVLYTVLAVALVVSTFGRTVSLMSDRAGTLLNLLLLAVQMTVTGAALYYFFDMFTPDMQLTMPDAFDARLVFFTYAGIAILGALVMFGPRMSMAICGLGVTGEKASAISTIRSAGGFALGLGLIGLVFMGNSANAPMDMLMGNLGVAVALGLAVIGRLMALALNRGNYIFAGIALAIEAAAAAVVISSVASMM